MKLLVCTQEYPPSYSAGIGNVVYNVVARLQELGVECTTCSPTGSDIQLGSTALIQQSGGIGILCFWKQVAQYFSKRNDYDVVWLHNPLFLTKCPFSKALVTIHSTYSGYRKNLHHSFMLKVFYNIMSRIERFSLRKLDFKFTCVGRSVLNELSEIGISQDNMIYISNGVDIERFKPSGNKKELRQKFSLPEDDTILLSLGRLTDAKQPYELIEVFSLIERDIQDIILVIAGSGKLLERTKRLAQKRYLKKVKFLGHVDYEKDVPDLYACSDFYIMSSKYEGRPLTLLEAISSGLPCIVSDIQALRFVEEARCGIAIDFNDVERAAGEINQYLKRDNSNHSRNAREYAVGNLNWKIVVGSYLQEFDKLK